jgi:acyl dehydratase
VIDVDSTICEVEGKHKQGAAFGYTKVLGYHPILASRADTGEVVHARLRKGSANTARGARRFLDELIARVRRAGATGEIVVRVDSGFWSKETIKTLGRLDVRYTMAVRTNTNGVAAVIAAIDEADWTPIAYTSDGEAQVAECTYHRRRLIVRRTRLTDAHQRTLWPDWRHFAFLTDLDGRRPLGNRRSSTSTDQALQSGAPGAVRNVTAMSVRHPDEPDARLWLQDIEVGSRYRTDDHEITSDEIVEFASRFDPQPFHLSGDGAADTIFESLAASGWHTAAITMRLVVTSGIPVANGIIGASIQLVWPTPTRPGDVVHVELTVTDVVPSRSKPDRGFVTCAYDTVNQHGDVRQRTTAQLLVFRRPPTES